MAHWCKTPKEMAELSGDEIEAMDYALALYNRYNMEQVSDVFGGLLGASWPVEQLLEDPKVEKLAKNKTFTWQLRPPRRRISLPLALLLAPDAMKQLRASALALEMQDRANPSVINSPSNSFFKGADIVDLSTVPKSEFLKFSGALKSIKEDD